MTSEKEREERALEALIVSRLRAACGDEVDPSKLPGLTDEQKASLECLKPGFIEDLIKQVDAEAVDDPQEDEAEEAEYADSELLCGSGMNRAEEIDDEANEELKRKRKELLEKLKEEGDARRDRGSG
jgi:hypothetical protein